MAAGAAARRHRERLVRREPAGVVGGPYLGEERREPERLEHVLVVGGAGAVRSQGDVHAAGEHVGHGRNAGRDLHVAGRVVGDGRAGVRHERDVVGVEPDAVGPGEARPEEPDVVQVTREALAVAAAAAQRLDLALGQMSVDAGAERVSEALRREHELVRALPGNGRGHRHPHAATRRVVEAQEPLAHDLQDVVARCGTAPLDVRPEIRGQGVHQSGNPFVEEEVGDRGRRRSSPS